MRHLGCFLTIVFLTALHAFAKDDVPGYPPAFEALARDGRELFEQGDYRAAEVVFSKLAAQLPDNIRALDNHGAVLLRLGRFEQAQTQIQKAVAIAPNDEFSHRLLGFVYYSQAKYDEASASLKRALSLDPKDAAAHNCMGITAGMKGEHATAIDELKSAINLEPATSDAYFNLAVVLATQRTPDVQSARGYYERALKLGAEPDRSLERLIGLVDDNGVRTVGEPATAEERKRLIAVVFPRF